MMSAIIADVGYCRCFRYYSCCRLPLMSTRFVRCLLSELDAAGHADALEIPFLRSSDVIGADINLDQCPHILDGTGNSNNAYKYIQMVLSRKNMGPAVWSYLSCLCHNQNRTGPASLLSRHL
jgi:hypothetical protein